MEWDWISMVAGRGKVLMNVEYYLCMHVCM